MYPLGNKHCTKNEFFIKDFFIFCAVKSKLYFFARCAYEN